MKKNHKSILIVLALLYAAMMVFLLFFRKPQPTPAPYWEQLKGRLNLVPFRTVWLYLRVLIRYPRPWLVRHAVVNLLGNVLLFVPLGLFPPLLLDGMKRYWKTLLLAAGIMASIELLQMLLLVGTCDVDDLILNLLGASIGYGLFRLLHLEKQTPKPT